MSKIMEPAALCGMELKNRLFRSATWVALCNPDGTLPPAIYDIYRELAQGGVGTIITELTDVSQWNNAIGNNMRLYSDTLMPDYQKLVELVHGYGAKIIPQLNMYQYARSDAPHKIVDVDKLRTADIEDIKRLYIAAAVRAKNCGFDAVQLHLAYGWLLYRFLSPHCNHRTDAYGGSTENRARIVVELIQGIKAALPGYPICAKFSFYAKPEWELRALIQHSEANEINYTEIYASEECAEICQILYENGLDFIEVLGDHSPLEKSKAQPSCYLALAQAVQKKSKIPIVLTGCNDDLGRMETIMQDDGIEFFALSRALIREPDLPARWGGVDRTPAKCIHCDGCYHTKGNRCRFQ